MSNGALRKEVAGSGRIAVEMGVNYRYSIGKDLVTPESRIWRSRRGQPLSGAKFSGHSTIRRFLSVVPHPGLE
jgi:hypothetical protein